MDADYRFFLENLEGLYAAYGHKVLAIKGGAVLGAYDSVQAAIAGTIKTEPFGTFIVQQCAPSEEALVASFAGGLV